MRGKGPSASPVISASSNKTSSSPTATNPVSSEQKGSRPTVNGSNKETTGFNGESTDHQFPFAEDASTGSISAHYEDPKRANGGELDSGFGAGADM